MVDGWVREYIMDGGTNKGCSDIQETKETQDDETPIHVHGGSDSRANWVTPNELENSKKQKGAGCLSSLLGFVAVTGTAGLGIYEAVKYFSS